MNEGSIRRRQPPARWGRIVTAAAVAALALAMQGVAPAAGTSHVTDHDPAQAAVIRERVAEVKQLAEDHEGRDAATSSEEAAQPAINRSISAIDYAARTRPVPLNLSVRGNASDQRFNHIERGRGWSTRTPFADPGAR